MYKMDELKIMDELGLSINSSIEVTIIVKNYNLINGQCTANNWLLHAHKKIPITDTSLKRHIHKTPYPWWGFCGSFRPQGRKSHFFRSLLNPNPNFLWWAISDFDLHSPNKHFRPRGIRFKIGMQTLTLEMTIS